MKIHIQSHINHLKLAIDNKILIRKLVKHSIIHFLIKQIHKNL